MGLTTLRRIMKLVWIKNNFHTSLDSTCTIEKGTMDLLQIRLKVFSIDHKSRLVFQSNYKHFRCFELMKLNYVTE